MEEERVVVVSRARVGDARRAVTLFCPRPRDRGSTDRRQTRLMYPARVEPRQQRGSKNEVTRPRRSRATRIAANEEGEVERMRYGTTAVRGARVTICCGSVMVTTGSIKAGSLELEATLVPTTLSIDLHAL